jgi:hypothetical protein
MQFWNAKVLLTGTVNCLKFTRVVSGKETSKKEGKAFFLGGGFPVFLKEAPRPHPIVGICQLICLSRQMLQASFPYALESIVIKLPTIGPKDLQLMSFLARAYPNLGGKHSLGDHY